MSKYNIRSAKVSDYEEIVLMYIELIKVLYSGFNIKENAYFYRIVIGWFENNKDIVICETDTGEIAGFTLGFIEDIGIVDPYYNGDIAYVKPEFRKTRVAYLLYKNVVDYATNILKMRCIAKAFVGDGNKEHIDKIQSRFGSPRYIEYITGEVKDGKERR